ncbi:MAG TPA: biliverdin-producing heme oxygenase [Kofleriaceae bacterium]|nr:biliverdin-producing heme oxygenase [Kofleriaceae bacterium]
MIAGQPVLRRLKAETAALHREAETYVHVLDPTATLAEYRTYLRRMHGYHDPVERRLATHAGLVGAGFDPARCEKARWLEHDLDALLDPAPRTTCHAIPAIADTATAIGVAYVLEGSMLGGRYVLSKLPPAIAEVRGRATRFLEGYGTETAARWRTFGEIVERVIEHAPDADARTDAAIAGARATFRTLIDWLALDDAMPIAWTA